MKVFLSWSGPQSRVVAEALNDWLPRVIQVVRPFFSPEIEKGARWSGELDEALEGTSFGIICLTPQNLKSTWIHYEAGALSKLRDARVWTFLLDLTPGDVGQPLGRFQHTVAEKEDVRKLVRTINGQLASAGATPLADRLLDEIFDDSWPRLEARLQEAREMSMPGEAATSIAPEARTERAMLEEMLELLRDQQRRVIAFEGGGGSMRDSVASLESISAAQSVRDRIDEVGREGVRLLQAREPSLQRIILSGGETTALVDALVLHVGGEALALNRLVAELHQHLEHAKVDLLVSRGDLGAVAVVLEDPVPASEVILFAMQEGANRGVALRAANFFIRRGAAIEAPGSAVESRNVDDSLGRGNDRT